MGDLAKPNSAVFRPGRSAANVLLDTARDASLVAVLTLFAAAWAGIEFGAVSSEAENPVAAVTLLVAVAATIRAATRALPAQNVWLAVGVIVLISSAVLMFDAAIGIPFGQMRYTDSAGPRLFGLVPWTMPLVWVVLVLNARGVARLIMRPWRKARSYGFGVIGIATVLAALFDVGLEPFASQINRFWVWQARPELPTWYGAPWASPFGWTMTTLLILGFATPVLINKRPAGQHRPRYQPLAIWLIINALFAVTALAHDMWLAFGVITGGNLTAALLAIRGAQW